MITQQREVRVTARDSVRAPFVAPEQSPVPTIAVELEKGLPDWTDRGVVVETPSVDDHKSRAGKAWLDPKTFTVGTVSRKPSVDGPRVRRPRPTTRRWKR